MRSKEWPLLFNIRGDPEIIINQCSKLSGAILGLITIVCGYVYSISGQLSIDKGVLLAIAIISLCIGLGLSIGIIFGKAEEKRLIDERKYRVDLALRRRELALKEQERKDNLAFREQERADKEQERRDNFALKEQERADKEQERRDNFALKEQAQNAEREIRLRELEIKAQQIALEEHKLAVQEAMLKASAQGQIQFAPNL